MICGFFENTLNNKKVFRKIGKGFNNKICYFIVFLVTIGILISLSGCGSARKAPVDSRTQKAKSSDITFRRSHRPLYYKVKKGDTLYSVAWQYGLDYKRLAHWNNIKAPYIIFIGKKLRLASKYQGKKKSSKNKRKKVNKKTVKVTNSKSKNKTRVKKNNKTGKTKVTKRQSPKKTKAKKTHKKSSKKSNNKKVSIKSNSGLQWVWPISGKVIQKFSPSKGKKGIDIAAKKGIKVGASERGKVVYSGHGLTGYGLLVIIKHNSEYLSAYAHNSKLIVKEGEVVKKGQVIAYTGKSATDRVKLHFEIRKNGQPVNPLKFLP